MANKSAGRYYVKNTEDGTFQDITTLFDGVAVLSLEGLLEKGEAVNVYAEQWVNEQEEDFLITTMNEEDVPIVIRKNVDVSLTFIVRPKYASSVIDVQVQHDLFVKYMTDSDVWLKTSYLGNLYVHCMCIKEYKPTVVKLQRGNDSYIMGTITLHTLDVPQE